MPRPSLARRAYDNVVARTAIYYAILALLGPWLLGLVAKARLTGGMGLGGAFRDAAPLVGGDAPVAVVPDGSIAFTVLIAMIGAAVVSLPVAWIFTLTRKKRGYQQSVVQLLVALPPVVAGIVVLVKFSLALAFSLAGIVAAVRFRNTLDDSKDAVYAFLAIGIGIASGVDLEVAFILSFVFNVIALALWYTDFGRRDDLAEDDRGQRTLRVWTSDSETRGAVELFLRDRVKRWSLDTSAPSDGALSYNIVMKKKDNDDALLDDVRAAAPGLSRVELA